MRKFIWEVIQETEEKEGNKRHAIKLIIIVSAYVFVPGDVLRDCKISLRAVFLKGGGRIYHQSPYQ